MEASDINGECKLCLQAVSTANLEISAYGHCFLDHLHTYAEIMQYFRGLNSIASEAVRAVMTAAEAQSQTAKTAYVRTIEEKSCGAAKEGMTAWTTELALRAAIRLYAPNQDSADRAFAYLLDK